MPARNRNWPGFGLDRIIDAAGSRQRTDGQLEALSNAIGQQFPDLAPRQRKGAVSYWLPADRHMLRALTAGGAAAAGGNLLIQSAVGPLLEAARPASVLQLAGAQIINAPAGAAEYVIPSWNEISSGGWIAEGADAPQASLSVSTATATPRTVASRIAISRRLILQSLEPIEAAVLASLRDSNRALMEAGFFAGSGSSSEPLGIINTPGVQTQSFAGAVPTYSELVSMVDSYIGQEGDFSRMTFFLHPADLAALMTQEVASGTGQFVARVLASLRQFSLFGVPVFATSAITQGKVILCDPSQIALVFWSAPQLLIDRTTGGKSISGAAEVVLLNDCDIAVTRPAQIVIGG